jgi:hypothetical protein
MKRVKHDLPEGTSVGGWDTSGTIDTCLAQAVKCYSEFNYIYMGE